MTLVTGLFILLRSATKITHKAQAVTCLATKWHVCATVDSFETIDEETPRAHIAVGRIFSPDGADSGGSGADDDEASDEEDDVDNTKIVPAYAHSTISFQKRQALGEFATLHWITSSFITVLFSFTLNFFFFFKWQ